MKFYRPTKIILLGILVFILAGAFIFFKVKHGHEPELLAPGQTSSEIIVNNIKAGDVATSPLELSGQAKGSWYFEGSFPVKLLDSAGKVIASSQAIAQGDWMVEGFVEFKAKLEFDNALAGNYVLLFENDNPSGLPQNHKEFRLPVTLGKPASMQP